MFNVYLGQFCWADDVDGDGGGAFRCYHDGDIDRRRCRERSIVWIVVVEHHRSLAQFDLSNK